MPISYVVVEEHSDTVAIGDVIRQDPVADPDNPVDPNSDIVITLYVSTGPADVPISSFIFKEVRDRFVFERI